MSIYDGIDDPNIPIGGARLYFETGRYIVQIDNCKETSADGFRGYPSFIVECEVLQSTNPKRPPGCCPGWVQPIKQDKKQRDKALANIKQFWSAILGWPDLIDPSTGQLQKLKDLCEHATSQANPLAGIKLGLVASGKKLYDGGDFTLHEWYPLTDFVLVLK